MDEKQYQERNNKNQQQQQKQVSQIQYKQEHHKSNQNQNQDSQQTTHNSQYQNQITQNQLSKVQPKYEQPVLNSIDNVKLKEYANDQFSETQIQIVGHQTRGNALTKYSIYLIRGQDKNGQINVARRFKQFYQMRVAMKKRWPGCFIPSIPAKNALNKNSSDVITQRQRYLNDFVKKISKLPYLYYSEQFQCLLRSKDNDCSNVFQKWSQPTSQAIIYKYRQTFSQLNGKQINADTNNQIAIFYAFLKKNQPTLQKCTHQMKHLAQSKDKVDSNYGIFFSQIFPNYQKYLLSQYVDGKQQKMLYSNPSQAKLAEHCAYVTQAVKKNPYWNLYDVILSQQRDDKAFIESLGVREQLQAKKQSIQSKILNNQKIIAQINLGKKSLTTMTSKGTPEQIKYKLQVQIEQLKKQIQNILILSDIIAALIVYIEIPKFKKVKASFYQNVLKKLAQHQINQVQSLGQVWQSTKKALQRIQK